MILKRFRANRILTDQEYRGIELYTVSIGKNQRSIFSKSKRRMTRHIVYSGRIAGEFYMVVATHIVKIRGTFDKNVQNEEKLRKYVRKKIIYDIHDSFHTHLELFKVDLIEGEETDRKGKIEVWVYVHAYPSEVTKDVIKKWIDYNIKEDGLIVEEFEYELITDMTGYGWEDKPFIDIPWLSFDDMDDGERKLFREKINKELEKQIEIDSRYMKKKEERRKEEGISHSYVKELRVK